jgi:hypothetical protein
MFVLPECSDLRPHARQQAPLFEPTFHRIGHSSCIGRPVHKRTEKIFGSCTNSNQLHIEVELNLGTFPAKEGVSSE